MNHQNIQIFQQNNANLIEPHTKNQCIYHLHKVKQPLCYQFIPHSIIAIILVPSPTYNLLELCPGPGNRDGKCGKREGIPSPSRSPREAGFRDGRSLTRVNVFGLFTRNLRSFLIVPKTSNTIDHKGSKSALKCSNSTTIEQPPPSPISLSASIAATSIYLSTSQGT
jgi:hypothetical protein